MGLNQKLKKINKSINLKIIHVKDTDRLNQAGSEIDSEVNIFHIFEPFRSLSPTSTGLFYFFSYRKKLLDHHGSFFKKNFTQKNIF